MVITETLKIMLILWIFLFSACGDRIEYTGIWDMKIPNRFVHMKDSKQSDILLKIPEVYIKKYIPEYMVDKKGSGERMLLIYKDESPPPDLNNTVLSLYPNYRKVKDTYSHYEKWIPFDDFWYLIEVINGEPVIKGDCTRGGRSEDWLSCNFQRNINGHSVSFHLMGSNVRLESKYEKFILDKMKEWERSAKN